MRSVVRYGASLAVALIVLLFVPQYPSTDLTAQSLSARHAEMILEVEAAVRASHRATGRTQLHPPVLAAMREVPRHEFVPISLRDRSYENTALPIGHGQTISQPYIVAVMTDLLELEPDDVVLDIGTGSGYQSAILSRIASRVTVCPASENACKIEIK